MAGPPVRVKGLKELRRDLKQIDKGLTKEVTKAQKSAAGPAARRASQLAPRGDTAKPNLADSVRPFASGTRAGIRINQPYAGVQNFGGSIRPRGTPITIRATGFATKAVEESMDDFIDDLGDNIDALAVRHGFR